jgi:hypothetical protein
VTEEPASFVLVTAAGAEITDRQPVHVTRHERHVEVHPFVRDFHPRFNGSAAFYAVLDHAGVPIAMKPIEPVMMLWREGPFRDTLNVTLPDDDTPWPVVEQQP